jgi:hypothetical protein
MAAGDWDDSTPPERPASRRDANQANYDMAIEAYKQACAERDALKETVRRLEKRNSQLEAELESARKK